MISAVIDEGSWPVPPVFQVIRKMGKVPVADMRMTFNMGIGYIIVIPKTEADKSISILRKTGYDSFVIGTIEKGGQETRYA